MAGFYDFSICLPLTLRPLPFLLPRGYTPSLRDRRPPSSKTWASPRTQAARWTPLEYTGSQRECAGLELYPSSTSKPGLHRHPDTLHPPSTRERCHDKTAEKMASPVTAAALASAWNQPRSHSIRRSLPTRLPGQTQSSKENRPIPSLTRPGDPNWRARTSGNCGSPALKEVP